MEKRYMLLFLFLLMGCSILEAGKAFPGVSYNQLKVVVQEINPATFDFNKPLTLSKNAVVKFFVNGVGANPAVANNYSYDNEYFNGKTVTEKSGKNLLGGMQYLKLKALKSTGNGMTQIKVTTGGKSKTIQVIIN